MNTIVAPSILSADFSNLAGEIDMLNNSPADWVHCDIMDGLFVPNISFGLPVVRAVKQLTDKPLDVHLMIMEPDRYLKDFRDAGADIITVQYEACTHLHRTISEIHALGIKAGVAINPHTPVMLLRNILPFVDMVLIMSVNPGFGGQSFIPDSLGKIEELKNTVEKEGLNVIIEVDGGVNGDNCSGLVAAGADALVAGNYIFGSGDPLGTIAFLKGL